MRFTVALSSVVFALGAASTAQAHLVVPFGKNQTVQQRQETIKANLRHVTYVCHYGKGRLKAEHCRAEKWLRRELRRSNPIMVFGVVGLPPHYQQWLCIHRFEGSWTDSGDPFWGGLQMDRQFMRTYAPRSLLSRGWANAWTPVEQMWVAERAWKARGFSPWPNTARYCGLL